MGRHRVTLPARPLHEKNERKEREKQDADATGPLFLRRFPGPPETWVGRYGPESIPGGKIWYRVRVGRYDSKEEAKKLEETLRTNENFAKAFATGR